MDREWIEHWIMDLINRSTVDTMSFKEWMWCPERYTKEELKTIEHFWKLRARCYEE